METKNKMKYLKLQMTEDEFDAVMSYGIFDIAGEAPELIMNHIRSRQETKNNHGNNNKTQK